ncbi:MAG TPA: hypothetical protein VMV10_07560 [Pirellulales bacterium]|nr:hypothetical protein [Pirellulales bacterium]
MQNEPPPDDSEGLDESEDLEEQDGSVPPADFKEPSWAFAINFFWPGAGLIYLRRPWLGLLNFAVVVAIAAAAWIALPDARRETAARWIGLVLCGGSGFLAYQMAIRANERLK